MASNELAKGTTTFNIESYFDTDDCEINQICRWTKAEQCFVSCSSLGISDYCSDGSWTNYQTTTPNPSHGIHSCLVFNVFGTILISCALLGISNIKLINDTVPILKKY